MENFPEDAIRQSLHVIGFSHILAREKLMKFSNVRFVGSYPDFKLAPKIGLPEIAFGGRSNVGKSSLINSIVKQRNLAKTSKAPGRTRLLNYFVVADGSGKERFFMVDLPGYGYAKVSLSMRRSWQTLVEGYIEASRYLRGFVLLIDSRRGLQKEELQLVEYLLGHEKKICPILTKSDKLSRQQRSVMAKETAETLARFGDGVFLPILHSSKENIGNDLIWRWINERICDEPR